MKRIGKFVIGLLLSVNALFVGGMLLAAYSPLVQPTEHHVWACLGLTFPIFLMINAAFLAFWLVVQQFRAALLPLMGLLMCCMQIRTYLPVNFSRDEVPEGSIKFLSYNIMGFGPGGAVKHDGKNAILEYLKESRADIICLQEYTTIDYPEYVSQKEIEKKLDWLPYHKVHTFGQYSKMACYSRYPILSARLLDYASENNGSVLYELKIGEDTVTVINNHLESNKLTEEDREVYEDLLKKPEKEKVKTGMNLLVSKLAEATAIRAPQADTVAKEIARTRNPYVIVCGDFNDSPISYVHRTISQGLDDAFTESGRGFGISYNKNKFYFRIDNILTSKNLKAYRCTVDRTIKESDHYPIYCYIKKRE